MPRADEFAGQVSNPVKKYISWDSDNKCFKHYDKELKKNISIPLPAKFTYLKQMATIRGFSEKDNSGMYSNEVTMYDLKTKELNVRTFNGKSIVSGKYSDIKDSVKSAGGKFAVNLYAVLNGELVCLTLFGSSFSSWYDFTASKNFNATTQYIEVNSAVEKKKGKTDYSEPVFTSGDAISDKDGKIGDDLYDALHKYFEVRDASSESTSVQEEVAQESRTEQQPLPKLDIAPETDSELPF